MLKKLTRILILLLTLLTATYLLFPWWAGWVVSANLPNNMTLLDSEVGYPRANGILVNRLKLRVDQNIIQIDHLDLKYDLEAIQIEKILISQSFQTKQQNQVPTKNTQNSGFAQSQGEIGWLLPQISSAYFNEIKQSPAYQIKRLDIHQFILENTQQRIDLNNVVFYHSSDKVFKFDLPRLGIQDLATNKRSEYSNLIARLVFEPIKKQLEAKINIQGINVLAVNYFIHQQKTSLLVKLNTTTIDSRLKALVELPGITLDDTLDIQVEEDLNRKTIGAKIEGAVLVEPLLLDHRLTSMLQFEAENIRIPLQINIDSEKTSKGLKTELNLTSQIKQDIGFSLPEKTTSRTLVRSAILSDLNLSMSSKIDIPWYNGAGYLDALSSVKLLESQLSLTSKEVKLVSLDVNKSETQTIKASNKKSVAMDDLSMDIMIPEIMIDSDNLGSMQWTGEGKLSIDKLSVQLQNEPTQKTDGGSSNTAEPLNSTLSFDSAVTSSFKLSHTIGDKSDLSSIYEFTTSGVLKLTDYSLHQQDNALAGQAKLNWNSLNLDLSQGDFALQVDATDDRIHDKEFADLSLQVAANLNHGKLNGHSQFALDGSDLLSSQFQVDLSSGNFNLSSKQNIISNKAANHLLTLVGDNKKMPLKIISGEIKYSGEFSWLNKLKLSSQIYIDNLLLKFGENEVQGFSLNQKISSIEPLAFNTVLSIEKIDFSSGLAIDNIAAEIASVPEKDGTVSIELSKVNGELLEGDLSAEAIKISAGKLMPSLIHLNKLSLTELIFLMDVSGLYAEGGLDIKLPIAMEDGSLVIDDAQFKAVGEGIIKYSSDDTQSTDQNIALQALRNFHYSVLEGDFYYNKQGEYQIKIHLLGSNPELYDGYPIDFVLNLKGELSGVFRSLFLTGNFEQAIMEQVKADELKSKPEENN